MPDRETDATEQGRQGGAAMPAASGAGAAGTAGGTTAGTAGGLTSGTAGGVTSGTAGAAGETTGGSTGGTTAGFTGAPPAGFTGARPPGFTGATKPSIFTNGWLITAAVIVAAIIAAVAGFFVLRSDPSQQTAQQSPTTNASPAPGATLGAATPGGPLLRGTYSSRGEVRSPAGTSTIDNIVTITSDCPGCDATVAGNAYQWNGNGWQMQTTDAISPGDTISLTPTVVVNGIVQELSLYYATCNGTVSSSTMTRIGD